MSFFFLFLFSFLFYIYYVMQLVKTKVFLCGFSGCRAHSINLGTALPLFSLKIGYCQPESAETLKLFSLVEELRCAGTWKA